MSAILLGGFSMRPLPMMRWDMDTYLIPPCPHLKPDMGPTPLLLTYLVVITGNKGPTPSPLLTFAGYHWKPVQTCSFEDLPPPQPVLTSSAPCRNFSNFVLKTTRSVISVHILVLVSMRKYILNHK